MKYLLVISLIFGAYSLYSKYQSNKYEPELGEHVIKVYGADSCKYTRETLAYLDKSGIEYQYRNIKNKEYFTEMLTKMKSKGMRTDRYEIPTLDIRGKLLVDPEEDVISSEYAKIN